MKDAFYTPLDLAEYMVRQVSISNARVVADFAAGDGALLASACLRWPKARAIAVDIDDATIRRLRKSNAHWGISRCDFLSPNSRARASSLLNLDEGADVILLNPPFSCRGASKIRIEIGQEEIECSRAMAFLLLATAKMSKYGQLVAILPESVFNSQKDKMAWEYLNERFISRRGRAAGRGVFKDCFARCHVVVLSKRYRRRQQKTSTTSHIRKINVQLVRGTAQLHSEVGSDRTLVHSTDLRSCSVFLNGRLASDSRPSIIGPAVLVPRVGQPRIDKVAVFLKRKRVALSDCVIGIQCASSIDASWLLSEITKNHVAFLELYSGTCARYITVSRLRSFLASIGCSVIA